MCGNGRETIIECTGCHERAPARIWSFGAIEPIGRDRLCACDDLEIRIVGGRRASDRSVG